METLIPEAGAALGKVPISSWGMAGGDDCLRSRPFTPWVAQCARKMIAQDLASVRQPNIDPVANPAQDYRFEHRTHRDAVPRELRFQHAEKFSLQYDLPFLLGCRLAFCLASSIKARTIFIRLLQAPIWYETSIDISASTAPNLARGLKGAYADRRTIAYRPADDAHGFHREPRAKKGRWLMKSCILGLPAGAISSWVPPSHRHRRRGSSNRSVETDPIKHGGRHAHGVLSNTAVPAGDCDRPAAATRRSPWRGANSVLGTIWYGIGHRFRQYARLNVALSDIATKATGHC